MEASWGEVLPSKPSFTEKDIPDQTGRVFLVTGGCTGIGYEVAKALYHANGRVYITSRSPSSGASAVASITASSCSPNQSIKGGRGSLAFLKLDLGDLSTIKATASEFLQKESRLDVIWHNAGVMVPDNSDELTKQGYHQQLGINALGPFLLQHHLTPLCLKTSTFPNAPKNGTRVIFVSSSSHRSAPLPDGVDWKDLSLSHLRNDFMGNMAKYGQSKAMNIMYAHELARQHGENGLISLSLHPGCLDSGLQKHTPLWFNMMLFLVRKKPLYGAYTELFAGLADLGGGAEKMLEDGGKNGSYILPFGVFGDGKREVFQGLKERATGERLWAVCIEMLKEYI